MKYLTYQQARNAYNKGEILQNRQNTKYTIVFSLASLHFTSTKKRAIKGKHYKLDNPYWITINYSLLAKLKLIFSNKVHLI